MNNLVKTLKIIVLNLNNAYKFFKKRNATFANLAIN